MPFDTEGVVQYDLRIAGPSATADSQVGVQFDLVRFCKHVHAPHVEQQRRYRVELDVVEVYVTLQPAPFVVRKVTGDVAGGKRRVAQRFKQEWNAEFTCCRPGVDNLDGERAGRRKVRIGIVRQDEDGFGFDPVLAVACFQVLDENGVAVFARLDLALQVERLHVP